MLPFNLKICVHLKKNYVKAWRRPHWSKRCEVLKFWYLRHVRTTASYYVKARDCVPGPPHIFILQAVESWVRGWELGYHKTTSIVFVRACLVYKPTPWITVKCKCHLEQPSAIWVSSEWKYYVHRQLIKNPKAYYSNHLSTQAWHYSSTSQANTLAFQTSTSKIVQMSIWINGGWWKNCCNEFCTLNSSD